MFSSHYCHSYSTPSPSLLCLSPTTPSTLPQLPSVWSLKKRNNNHQLGWALNLRCNAISKPTTKDYRELLQDELPLIQREFEIVEDDVEGLAIEVLTSSEIKENVERIREILKSMNDGEISISPYDTAWVALVKNSHGSPQFPSSLQWIIDNQLSDGSWGDDTLFSAHDRIINTLACLIALKSWEVHPEKCQKGITFLKENISKLQDENFEHMPIGFEVAFPSLIEVAQNYGIEVAQDTPAMQEIYAKRNLKLTRIPKEIMHRMPTTLLHSLEGMAGLDWDKLLKLQSKDGSFLFSPSSTAYALMQTKDLNCFTYLNNIVRRFNGGVPNVYPIDLFEHIWVVDRLQRLGISRYFQHEIDECMSYVNRYWTEHGICWARNSNVQDIDDTAMGFRLLRLHGYQVSADVFKNFEKDGEFFCFVGQSTQAVTGMFNLLRASQIQFPGENILEEAKNFSSKYLKEKRVSNQLLDKWTITKDLPGEVTYALDIPWYASLPRVETRLYIEQYGGEKDVWIGKTLYRMPNVSNNAYLELAKSDFNNTQALHRLEWNNLLRWHSEYNLRESGVSQRSLLMAYYLAAATMFEPEKSKDRLAWAKTAALIEAIDFEFSKENASAEERREFVNEFQHSYISQGYVRHNGRKILVQVGTNKGQNLMDPLLSTLNQLSLDALMNHGRDIRNQLYQAWEKWLKTWEEEGDRYKGEAELMVETIELSAGRWISHNNMASDPHILSLLSITNHLCHHFGHLRSHQNYINNKQERGATNGGATTNGTSCNYMKTGEVEEDLQKLMKIILSRSINGAIPSLKQACLAQVKSFFYAAHCTQQEINFHINKVLFEKVD
ncbi:ent-copalyl diphosphate synthase, chloroplastic-like isoform X1 [Chenopodium quinoa]|uniref:ent-copalyl diphosphate synthase, chloroplastic-like isoform X1 n=1 Tax=Chenopodium quinoa TaxID=63459 RepID=UPI000B787D36|nr:ent-copalyl diphosphate synthase, chloroplastic-like isoform X1 [Chenopodium quinoa]